MEAMIHFRRISMWCLMLLIWGCQDDVVASRDMAWVVDEDMSDVDQPAGLDASDLKDSAEEMDIQPLPDMPGPDMMAPVCAPLDVEQCITQQLTLWDPSCENELGVFFDGAACRPAQGCACEDGTCPAFDSMEACARTCGQEGQCAQDVMPWGTYSIDMCVTVTCQEGIAVCYNSEQDPTDVINQRFPGRPGFQCSPPEANSICESELELDCSQQWCCYGPPEDGFEARTELQALCGASLYPEVLGITCINLD
jgi:hypothetical protein